MQERKGWISSLGGRGGGKWHRPTSNSAACNIILQKYIKTFSDQQKLRESVARSALQETLKVLQRERNGQDKNLDQPRSMLRSIRERVSGYKINFPLFLTDPTATVCLCVDVRSGAGGVNRTRTGRREERGAVRRHLHSPRSSGVSRHCALRLAVSVHCGLQGNQQKKR